VLVPTLLQMFAGPSLVGAVRGAQSLASIPAQLPTALQPVLLADTSRKHQRGAHAGESLARWALMVSSLFAAAVLVALVVPDSLGVRFFGESWPGIDQALVGILLSTWATSCLIAVEAWYRVQRSMARLSTIRLLGLVLVCTGSVVGAEVAGARGAAFGLALANITVLAAAVAARPAHADAERIDA
jgi:O-antigen/teichoic acid export membrane protein